MRTNKFEPTASAKNALLAQKNINGSCAPKKARNKPSLNVNRTILPSYDFAHNTRALTSNIG